MTSRAPVLHHQISNRDFKYTDNHKTRLIYSTLLAGVIDVDIVSLEIFRAVASELGITKAAAQLGRVQSNVTTRIQQLELELGVELFSREGKKLRLTDQGALFLQYTNRMLALANEARQAMHPTAPQGVLRVGAMESTAASRLPAPLSQFHGRFPQVVLQVSTGPSQQLIQSLERGEIDCALVALPHDLEGSPEEFLNGYSFGGEPAYAETLNMVLPRGYTQSDFLNGTPSLSLAAFKQGCSYRAIATEWMTSRSSASANPLTVHEVGSYHAMLACVAAGQSFSVLPESVMKLSEGHGNVEVCATIPATTWLVWRSGYSVAAFQAFRDVLRDSYSEPLEW